MQAKPNPVALAVWKDKHDLFDRVGAGRDYTQHGDSSGLVRLSFRSVEADDLATMASLYGDQPVSDICLLIWFDNNGAFSMGFNAYAIGSVNQRKVEAILRVMKQWNTRAEKLYEKRKAITDTRESFGDCLRRMLKAAGAITTLCIGDWYATEGRKYENISLDVAIAKYVMPAIGQVRAKLKDADMLAA